MTRLFAGLLLSCLCAAAQAQNYAGQWWDPAKNGMGLSIGHEGNTVGLAWYHYTSGGLPTFLTFSCTLTRNAAGQNACAGQLIRSFGPQPMRYSSALFATGMIAGGAALTFTSATSGVFQFDLQGQVGQMNIVPLVFSNGPATGTRYGGLWWNPDENGMGYSIGHQGNDIGMAWYHYNEQSQPTFLIFACSLGKDAQGRDACTGLLKRSTGPLPLNYDPAQFKDNIAAGSATLAFETAKAAYLTYAFEGQFATVVLSPMSLTTPAVPRKLLLPIANPTYTGSQPLMVIDLASGAISSSGISQDKSINCIAGNLTAANQVRVICGSGTAHYDYDPRTSTVTPNTALAQLPVTIWHTVVSAPSGLDYYGTGVNYGSGRVVVRNGNSFPSSFDISTALISHLVPDFVSGKMFTLNRSASNVRMDTAKIDRLDLKTGKLEATVDEDDHGVTMALYQGELYLIMRRDNSPNDIVKYNATTFERLATNSIAGPGPGQTAYSLAVDGNGVHVGTSTGISTLSHNLLTVLRTTVLATAPAYLAANGGKLYAIVNSTTDNVLELNAATLDVIRGWTIPGEPYRPVVISN